MCYRAEQSLVASQTNAAATGR
ncbi:hypothetical protein FG05_35369 [Fusarium graminearum]|nr:hypothetical protein FG05_35369 [Fusarium graminearum]